MVERNSVFSIIVAFVLAESMSVWASWNPPPFNLGAADRESIRKGEIGAISFSLAYGLFGTIVTKNLLPFLVSIGFSYAMHRLYSTELEKVGK